jgi:hypothetical protein
MAHEFDINALEGGQSGRRHIVLADYGHRKSEDLVHGHLGSVDFGGDRGVLR